MRWLWRDWQTNIEIKANLKGESKWKGYEVLDSSGWNTVATIARNIGLDYDRQLVPTSTGDLYILGRPGPLYQVKGQELVKVQTHWDAINGAAAVQGGNLQFVVRASESGLANQLITITPEGRQVGEPIVIKGGTANDAPQFRGLCSAADGTAYVTDWSENMIFWCKPDGTTGDLRNEFTGDWGSGPQPCLSPDQTMLYVPNRYENRLQIGVLQVHSSSKMPLRHGQWFFCLEDVFGLTREISGLCVDTEGRLYVATALGIQVCDQAGRVNFIIPTPQQPYDVCFGGKDLGELFIACGDKIYKRPTKVHGIVSGQMPPIKPAPPKL